VSPFDHRVVMRHGRSRKAPCSSLRFVPIARAGHPGHGAMTDAIKLVGGAMANERETAIKRIQPSSRFRRGQAS
jgi:hypothetical protein